MPVIELIPFRQKKKRKRNVLVYESLSVGAWGLAVGAWGVGEVRGGKTAA